MAIRVYDLAKEYDINSKEFVDILKGMNINIKNHMSAMSDQQEKYFRNNFDKTSKTVTINKKPTGKNEAPSVNQPKPQRTLPQNANPVDAPKPQTKSETPSQGQPVKASPNQGTQNRTYQNRNTGERTNNQNTSQGERGSYQNRPQGERGTYQNRPQGERGSYQSRQQGERGPYQGRPQGERGSYQNRPQGENNSYQSRPQGERSSYQNRPQGERGTYQGRPQGERGSYQNRPQGESGSYQGRPQGERGAYQGRPQGERGTYQGRPQGERGTYQGRPQGERGTYQGRPQGERGAYQNRPQGERGAYQGRSGAERGPRQGAPYQGDNRRPYQQRPNNGPAQKDRGGVASDTPSETITPARRSYGNEKSRKDKKDIIFEKDAKITQKGSKTKKDSFKKPIDNTKKTKGIKSDYKKKPKEMGVSREEAIIISESITVGDLATKLGFTAADIIKILMNYGVMAGINQSIDFETAEVVADELGYTLEREKEEDVIENLLNKHNEDPDKLKLRAPIITVMGHVDHGKTSLLDAIRHTNVISGEAGGITQHIGAYSVNYQGHMITFIDTPGHEAFTAMRSRGASVTDIAILVVAADDGVMPQTIEAINHAKAAGVPIIVAINKVDKPEANPDRVKQELTEYGLVAEEWGGTTICVAVSAKAKTGIDQLLEMILLVSEVEDLKANYEMPAVGTVIESRLDKSRGATLTLLVKSGTLNTSDIIVCGAAFGKVRAMYDDKGRIVKKAVPSTAVEVIGFPEVAGAGDKFYVAESEKDARKVTQIRKNVLKEKMASGGSHAVSLDDLFDQISQGELKELKLIVKADVDGSYEALKQSLEKLNNNKDNVKVSIIHGGVGAVSETDVVLAAASNAIIIAFNVRPNANAKTMSQKEKVEIRTYRVIYQVTEEIEKAMKGMLDPEFKEVHLGDAQVRQTFRLPGGTVIAGCYVQNGTILRKNPIRVIRDSVVVYEGNLGSLRRVKDDVKEVSEGFECGMGIDKYNDIKEGDIIESYEMQEVKRD